MDISSNLAVAPPPPAAPAADRAPARDAVQPVKTEAARVQSVPAETATVVYKAVDPEDGDVVRQVPEDVILKLRATYNSEPLAQDAGSDSKPGEIHRLIDRIA